MERRLAFLKSSQKDSDVIVCSVPYAVGRCRTANLIIAHVNVSRNHCSILQEGQSWKLNDFSSSGTYVNDTLVGRGKSANLRYGDIIRFGPPESNLLWTFYPLDCMSEKSEIYNEVSRIKPRTQVLLNFSSKKNEIPVKPPHEQSNIEERPSSALELNVTVPVKANVSDTSNISFENPQSSTTLNASHDAFLFKVPKINDIKPVNINNVNPLTIHKENAQNISKESGEDNVHIKKELDGSNNEKDVKASLLENFADLMETELQCTICSELLVTAVTLNCTHTFCKFCIDQWKGKQKNCPICRKKISRETRSLVLDNYIDKMVENLSEDLRTRRQQLIAERENVGQSKKPKRAKQR